MFCCTSRTYVSLIKYKNQTIQEKYKNKKTVTTKKHALIIFDWDDTLFATSALKFLLRKYMITHKLNVINSIEIATNSKVISEYSYLMPNVYEEYKDQFILLSETIKNTLIHALKLGFVVIVTNASIAWLQTLCDTFLPNLYEWMLKHIHIHSASDEYKKMFPNSSHRWKELCFSNIIEQQSNEKLFTEIISIGDSNIERKATILVANKYGLLYKILKIPVYMNLTIVQEQCKLFENMLETLYLFKTSIDYKLSVN